MIIIQRTSQVGFYGVDQYGRYWATINFGGRIEICALCHQEMTNGYVCGPVYACSHCAKMTCAKSDDQ